MFGNFQISPVVKNLLIINVLVYAASWVLASRLNYDINETFGLHYFQASNFNVWQFVTFLFLHGSISHVFFNMFAVFQFGNILERVWGARRFLVYYLITGVGSGIIQQAALYFDIHPFVEAVNTYLSNPSTEAINELFSHYGSTSRECSFAMSSFINEYNNAVGLDMSAANKIARDFMNEYQILWINGHVTIGASGAVFGILLAFGMMFPNLTIMLMIPPIPIKAKYFVIIYGLIELFAGVANFSADNVAHWAHLGGMLFGFFLIRKWQKEGNL